MKKIKYLLILLFLLPLSLLAQQTTISGKVIDYTDGTTLPGVSVRIKGTTTGTVTDANGKFQISVPAGAILQVTYIFIRRRKITLHHSLADPAKDRWGLIVMKLVPGLFFYKVEYRRQE